MLANLVITLGGVFLAASYVLWRWHRRTQLDGVANNQEQPTWRFRFGMRSLLYAGLFLLFLFPMMLPLQPPDWDDVSFAMRPSDDLPYAVVVAIVFIGVLYWKDH